jgi:hypothetical protein
VLSYKAELKYVQPVLNAEDLTDSPYCAPSRHIINFAGVGIEIAKRASFCMRLVEERVKPMRQIKTGREKEFWWQFRRTGEAYIQATRGMGTVIVNPVVAKYVTFVFTKPDVVFTNALNIFAFEKYAVFTSLQSRTHELWVIHNCSTLEDRTRYNPSDCFETFPFPKGFEGNPALESAGKEYYEFRAALMVRNNEGLTKTYNRFHDPEEQSPDILQLRELHAVMDRAVLDAYGWKVLQPTCEFLVDYEDDEDEDDSPTRGRGRKKPWRYRWPDDFRDEVLARLLELNRQYAEEEALSGAGADTKPKRAKKLDRELNKDLELFRHGGTMATSRLSKLSNPHGKWLLDRTQGEWVYHVDTPHLFIQAAGYLKHVHGATGTKAIFYRGQEKLYKGELKPSLYRGLSTTPGQQKLNEALNAYLATIGGIRRGVSIVAEYVREPLLQHYGIRTRWIDLVDNIWVALWFACYRANVTGRSGEYLNFEQRKSSKRSYAYILLIEVDWNQVDGSPGLYSGPRTETVDLRTAAPSTYVRPHAQHAILSRLKTTRTHQPLDYGKLVSGVIRVALNDALEWLGDGVLLTPHVLFPPPFYDYGYRDLLNCAPPSGKGLGAINHVGA